MAAVLILYALPVLMVVAALSDLTRYRIPNWISLALLAAFAIAAPLAGLTLADLGTHALVGFGALVVGFALFAFGTIGGGDAKLFAAGALWFGLDGLAHFSFAMALTGGVMCAVILGVRHLDIAAFLPPWRWVEALRDKTNGVPYGVAIAAGAVLALPTTEWMALAYGVA